ncbi:GNAT family N-acetyltransferase [Flammeovirga agarivorans]|uniref:GNAT family N-acetyltransferase n=1 Tax=Flammeovirga agarivorans TaxID=2726742 RepID=A0A7X8SHL0_9BACT|nr:GNAT family N-acetyltransferase [Flammeovirga agarivorans]NLR90384.1 GNAT family N-acetyltransferase [Flammeovirga agarivorans]
MINITKATTNQQLKHIEVLAKEIWNEHYVKIIGQEQVDYMLDKFQSFSAMEVQVENGLEYYTLSFNNKLAGYLAFKEESDQLFLSKIYVLAALRGNKIAKHGMNYVVSQAQQRGKGGIRLTVNKYNEGAIKAYAKMGFEKIDDVVADIGKGYVMDDFVLLKKID